MADRRMFAREIIESDEFTEMEPSTQALYFHICMSADDDGFSNKIRQSMFNAHATEKDLEELLDKKFLLRVNGVIVVKHWLMNNLIRGDRKKETNYKEELSCLIIKENKSYKLDPESLENQERGHLTTKCQPSDNQCPSNDSTGKDSIVKDSIGEYRLGQVREGKDRGELPEPIPEREEVNYSSIVELYNSICVSFPQVTKLSDARKKTIKARLNSGYTIDDLKKAFEMSEESNFLKGANDRNWRADFDWMMKDSNIAKILDGKYSNKPSNISSFGKNQVNLDEKYNMIANWANN